MLNFGDRLYEAIADRRAPVCVGLDPLFDQLPEELASRAGTAAGHEGRAAVLERFCSEVIGLVAETVPVVKINIAFFERYYDAGVAAYYRLVRLAQQRGMLVIGDIKRADIGHSTTQYAAAHLEPVEGGAAQQFATPDAVTVQPYLGLDGVAPFLDVAKAHGRGVFVLVQTSNPAALELQGISTDNGAIISERVASHVAEWGRAAGGVGSHGYGPLGAVVSPLSNPEATARLRGILRHSYFLVPGFGAQGLGAAEVLPCFAPDGGGAIVNASRSVIFAYRSAEMLTRCGGDWRACIRTAAREFVESIRQILPGGPR